MTYSAPKLRVEGLLDDVLRHLIPKPQARPSDIDWRVQQLVHHIDNRIGSVEWNLAQACQELKLGISAPHAARLFKRHTGLGIREYAKAKRLLTAAERLIATDLPVKVIATEFGYRRPFDFARRFKAQYHLSPTQFRKRSA